MAITRPVTRTIISTTAWGVPVTDEVNRLTAAVAALTPGPWTDFALVNGWTMESGFAPLQYRKNGDKIEIRSSVKPGANGSQMAVLPVGYRPIFTHRLYASCYNQTLNQSVLVRCDLSTAGTMTWYDIPAGGLFITMTGMSFPLN